LPIPHQIRSDLKPPPFIFRSCATPRLRRPAWGKTHTLAGLLSIRFFEAAVVCAAPGIKRGVDVHSRPFHSKVVVCRRPAPQARPARKAFLPRPFPLIASNWTCEHSAILVRVPKSLSTSWRAAPMAIFGTICLSGVGGADGPCRVRDEQRRRPQGSSRPGPRRATARRGQKLSI